MRDIKAIVKTIVEGLMTDGGHHKQWYLECALMDLVGKEDFDKLKEKYEWEEGIIA